MKTYDIAVVGSGAAGSMGALRAVLNNLETICFMGSPQTKKRARATWVGKVENMPVLFDKPKAVFQSSQEVFKWIETQEQWKEMLHTVKDSVSDITGHKGAFTLKTSKGESFQAKYILLCTGIMDVQPLIQGKIQNIFPMANAGHIEYCIRCDGHKSKGKETVIIGHNESALWIATLLKERYNNPKMTVLTNGQKIEIETNSEIMKRISCYGIQIKEPPIKEIKGDAKNAGLEGFVLEDGEVVSSQMAFVSLGTLVYNDLAKALHCKIDERGYVVCDDKGETSTPGVFAGGDLRADRKKQIYTAWDTTVDSVDKIDSHIREEKRAQVLKQCEDLKTDPESHVRR